ncbi:DNA internalization-related competence protein ComEC/Rec2 [Pseudoalteromonas sp. GB56]
MGPCTSSAVCSGFSFGCILSLFTPSPLALFTIIVILVIIRINNGYLFGYLRFCVLGIVYTIAYFYIFFHWHGPEIDNSERDVVAVVETFNNLDNQVFVTARLKSITNYTVPSYQTFRVSLGLQGTHVLHSGDVLKFTTRVRKKVWRVNFDVRDSRIYGFTHRLVFVASTPKSLQIDAMERENVRDRYKLWLDEKLEQFRLSGVFKALLSGDRDDITLQHLTMLKHTGTSHLIAISGLHIALLFGFCFYILKAITYLLAHLVCKRIYQQQHTNIFLSLMAVILCGVFVFLCDFPVSAQRAWIMLSVFTFMYFSHNQYSLLKSLLVAFCAVLVFNPFALLEVGMWLSFCAVAVIFVTLVHTQGRTVFTRYLLVQLSLFVALAPLSFWAFNGVSIVSPIANLILVPAVSFILLPLLLLNVICGFSTPFVYLLNCVDMCLSGIFKSLAPLEQMIWLDFGQLPLWGVIVIYVVSVLCVYIRTLIPVVYAVSLLFTYGICTTLGQPKWRVDVLDVGHGLSVVVSADQTAIVYDLGARYFDQYSIVKNTLLPHIEARSLTVEHTIISHSDNDHSGGFTHWIDAGFGETLMLFHPQSAPPCQRQSLRWHGLQVEVLWPDAWQESDNASSCVVYITDGIHSVLLPGDIGAHEEQRIVAQGSLPQIDVVISPHHGSKTSSSEQFVETVNATHVVHSSSNRYGWQMPHPSVFSRYQEQNAQQWLTKHHGGIKVAFYTDNIVVQSAKQQKKYWFITD